MQLFPNQDKGGNANMKLTVRIFCMQQAQRICLANPKRGQWGWIMRDITPAKDS